MKRIDAVAIVCLILVVTADAMAQRGPGRGGRGGVPGGPQGRGGTERLLDEISLSNMQQGMDARAALVAYDQTIREQTLAAREVLLGKMKSILATDQFERFRDDLAQIPLVPQLPPGPRGVAAADLVERVVGFDANQDGKITRQEMPERMLALFEQGDLNRDEVLDRDELRALAARNSVDNPQPGRGGRGRRGGGGPPQN